MAGDGTRRREGRGGYLLRSWLELGELLENDEGLRRLLFDPVTGLPTTPLLFPRISLLLEEHAEVALLCVNVVKYSKIEEIYGWKVFDEVMAQVGKTLEDVSGSSLRDSDIVAELMISGNAFVIVLSPPRTHPEWAPDDLEAISVRVESRIREDLLAKLDPALYAKFGCYVGSVILKASANARVERLVYEGLERAMLDSDSREAEDAERRKVELGHIIDAEDVRTLVMPVVRLSDYVVIGYEALSRGPVGGEFERPAKLFRVAYDADLVMNLERLCRRKAVDASREMPGGRLLFLNIEPESIADPELRNEVFATLLSEARLAPDRIVLEITERSAIVDFAAFRSTLEFLRTIGFSVAVDDAGAGYGSLQCLAEVRPEWIKIDISLVRGIDGDIVRQQLVESLVTFAERMHVNMIAEGIETAAELKALRRIGVIYGQGFLFGTPAEPFPPDPVKPTQ